MQRFAPSLLVALFAYVTVAHAADTILVLPFTPITQHEKNASISQGIQQNLLNDLSQGGKLQILAPTAQPAQLVDVDAATKAARAANAGIVIYGSFQSVDTDIRITGQVLSVASGKQIGSLRATGRLKDLFELQDILANQAHKLLIPPQSAQQNEPNSTLSHYSSAPTPQLTIWQQAPRPRIYGDVKGADYRRTYGAGYDCYWGYYGCGWGCWGGYFYMGNLSAWHGGW